MFLQWPWSAASSVLPAWMPWASGAADPLWSNCVLQTDPAQSAPQVTVGGLWLGSTSELSSLVDQLTRAAGAAPTSRSLESVPFGHAMYVEAGCAALSQDQCHLPSQAPGGVLTRQPSLAKSDYLNQTLSDAGVQAMLAGIDGRRDQGGKGAVGFDSYGGAPNRVAPDATAFVHRRAVASAQYGVPFTPSDSAATLARAKPG